MRWGFKWDVSSDASPIRLRQHGTFSFSQKFTQSANFCEKDGFFRLLEAISPVKRGIV
jgi:hypothetical protein